MINTFEPDIITYSDYYPFGWTMPGREGLSDHYRFGFNGMEKDDEIKGSGNSLDFEARIYDPRLGRFLSIDPLAHEFPNQAPYSAFNDNPVYYVDPDGRSGVAYKTDQKNKEGKPIVKVVSNVYIYGKGATTANANTMQANAMKQYNNNGDYFNATIDGVEYEVQFEINVQVIDANKVDGKLVEGGYGSLNAENNYYEMRDDITDAGQTLSGRDVDGSRGGNTGVIKTSEVGTPTPSHELNHGYGGENKDLPEGDYSKSSSNDIAVQGKNSTDSANRKVTQGNIDAIFKNVSFKGGDKANVGNPRPQLYDKQNGSRQVPQN